MKGFLNSLVLQIIAFSLLMGWVNNQNQKIQPLVQVTSTPVKISSSATITPQQTTTLKLTPSFTPSPIPRKAISKENVKNLEIIHQFSESGGKKVAWSGDGKIIAVYYSSNIDQEANISLYDSVNLELNNYLKIEYIETGYHRITNIFLDQKGDRLLLIFNDASAVVFDTHSGEILSKVNHALSIEGFCPGGKQLWQSKARISYATYYDFQCVDSNAVAIFDQKYESSNTFSHNGNYYYKWDNQERTNSIIEVKSDIRIDLKNPIEIFKVPSYYKFQVTERVFSPDGSFFLLTGYLYSGLDHVYCLILYDLANNGLPIFHKTLNDEMDQIAFNYFSDMFALVNRDTLRVFSLKDFKEIVPQNQTGFINSATFCLDGQILVTGTLDNNTTLWNTNDWKAFPALEGILPYDGYNWDDYTESVVCSTDGKTLAVLNPKGIQIWDITSRKLNNTIIGKDLDVISLSPDGRYVAAGIDKTTNFIVMSSPIPGGIYIWDTKSGELIKEYEGFPNRCNPRSRMVHSGKELFCNDNKVYTISFSPEGKYLAAGGFIPFLKLINLETDEVSVLKGYSSYVNGLAFNQDGTLLATASSDGTIKIWDMEAKVIKNTLKPIYENKYQNVVGAYFPAWYRSKLLFLTNTNILISFENTEGNLLKFWDLESGRLLFKKKMFNGYSSYLGLAASPDSSLLAIGSLGIRTKILGIP